MDRRGKTAAGGDRGGGGGDKGGGGVVERTTCWYLMEGEGDEMRMRE